VIGQVYLIRNTIEQRIIPAAPAKPIIIITVYSLRYIQFETLQRIPPDHASRDGEFSKHCNSQGSSLLRVFEAYLNYSKQYYAQHALKRKTNGRPRVARVYLHNMVHNIILNIITSVTRAYRIWWPMSRNVHRGNGFDGFNPNNIIYSIGTSHDFIFDKYQFEQIF